MRRWLLTTSFLVPLTLSAPALADGDCPPGSWFCEEVDVPQPNLDESGPAADSATDAPSDATDAPKPKKKKKAKKSKKQPAAEGDSDTVVVQGDGSEGGETVVIVKQKPGQRVVVVGDDGEPVAAPAPPDEPEPRKKRRRWRERFGLNLRLEGAAFLAKDEGAGMGGIGASFRWRPSPYFALDVGTDIVGGVDYDGNDRVEIAGSLSGLVYFNPQDRVQVYGIGGIHMAHAEVDTTYDYCSYGYCSDWGWSDTVGRDYIGAHGGLGVEFRLSRHIGLHLDALALIREKVDDGPPEFVDAQTGETTNTSGAGLFRAGINFWW